MSRDLTAGETDALREQLGRLQKRYPSQMALAQALDVNQSSLSRLTHGKQGASLAMAERVATLLSEPPPDRAWRVARRRVSFGLEPTPIADSDAARLLALEQRVAALEAAQSAAFRLDDANSDSMAVEN